MSKVQQKLLITKIKNSCLKLYGNKQLPSYLAFKGSELTLSTPKSYIDKLIYLTEKFMRVSGYYKKYPDEHKRANDFCKSVLEGLKEEI